MLKLESESNMMFRKEEVYNASPIIDKGLNAFELLLQERAIEKSMQHIPREIQTVKHKAIDEVFSKRIDELDDTAKDLLMEMMDYMEKKCIAIPMKAAKKIL